ncbi:A/G-specific adenine glycosylase [soil metagenome]
MRYPSYALRRCLSNPYTVPMKTMQSEAQQALLDWYRANARDLPWRRTRDPYRIMVSEIMLQQTQVDRVIPKYHTLLEQFPTLEALAAAPASEVIRAWAGLGYNRRALNLQRAARAVVEDHGGEMPRTVEELRSLPGIGPYTAGAIACFAFEQDVGFADTNIRRVLHRVLFGPEVPQLAVTPRKIEQIASRNVPDGEGYGWNQALIELGALVCRARSTDCEVCPLASWCIAHPVINDVLAEQQSTRVQRRKRKPAERFETTSRYFRGRIVDLLRDAPHGLTADQLANLIDADRSENGWLQPYVAGLLRDGLIVAWPFPGVAEEPVVYDTGEPSTALRYRLPE